MTETKILPDTARLWVYQNTEAIADEKIPAIASALSDFAANWQSHNHPLDALGQVLHNRFVILAVDETREEASGCSIDTSVHFMRDLERTFGLDLFNRMFFSYRDTNGAIYTVDHQAFSRLFAEGKITDETIVFDTMIKTYGDLQHNFEKPLKASWHKRMV